ncbi:LnmK family bifunctional acyltransferase/decarboxylase [Streptomyces sp. NPDC005900]|uniref:LnmK family bifunctional acyltransferase/decarboxylase n=1 Tax=Streptomyces sp. NPDC005900 TaxID=3154569 RepID=UPI0033C84C62
MTQQDTPRESLRVPALDRRVTVTPSMCGPNPHLYARIGDWTWETVAESCGIDVLTATNPAGDPAYLSFYYCRLRGSALMHPQSLRFGDRLAVTSASFGFGSQSVNTLHRIVRPAEGSEDVGGPHELDLVEFYDRPRTDTLYVENVNNWISRSNPDTNEHLVRASPQGFHHAQLHRLPPRYSPRSACARARDAATFFPHGVIGHRRLAGVSLTQYEIDLTRDLNGVGLVYFASFYPLVQKGILQQWRATGRTSAGFLARRETDIRLGYFGNVDAHHTLDVRTRLWRSVKCPGAETAEVAIREQHSGRLLVVAAVQYLTS